MEKFYVNLEDLLPKHTKEVEGKDVTDFKGASNELYSRFEKHFSKNLPTEEALMEKALVKAEEQIVTKLGIESVTNLDGFTAYAKKLNSSTDETKEALIRVEGERDGYKTKFNDLTQTHTQLNSEFTTVKRRGVIVESKFKDKYIDTALLQAGNMVTEELDFAGAVDKIKESYPEWLTSEQKNAGGGGTGQHEKFDKDDAETKEWEEKYL